jgi:hypothetical protein
MPTLLFLSLLFEILCIVHIIKTDRDRIWIWIILGLSLVGCLIYFFMEVLPDLLESRTGRVAATQLLKTIDPQRDLKQLAKNLEISDNVENKVKLAQACVAEGLYEEAIGLYQRALAGIYQDDPHIMLGLATAFFHQGDYAKAKETLNHLIVVNPKFRSQEGHLLFARTLEALQENEAALAEYTALISYFTGLEAKCRYALLLKKQGHTEKANELFDSIIKHAKNLPRNYRRAQKQWIDIASQQVSG